MNDLMTDSFVAAAPRDQDNRNGDIEMGMERQTNSGDLGLENFFKQTQEIEKQYEKLNTLLRKLQDAHEETKAVTKAASMKAIKKRMEKDVDEVGKIARSIKSKIEELDKENLANRQKPGCEKGSGADRTRTTQTVALKKKFKDRTTEFQTLRENIHQEYREVVERRVFTATGTGEEVKPDFIVHYPTRYYPSPKYLIGLDFVGRHDVAGFFAEIVDNDRLVFWDLGELDVVCFHELWVGEELAPGFAHSLKPMD